MMAFRKNEATNTLPLTPESQKKLYSEPRLQVYGDIGKITQGSKNSGGDGFNHNHKTGT
jgi:hypothetical protein